MPIFLAFLVSSHFWMKKATILASKPLCNPSRNGLSKLATFAKSGLQISHLATLVCFD